MEPVGVVVEVGVGDGRRGHLGHLTEGVPDVGGDDAASEGVQSSETQGVRPTTQQPSIAADADNPPGRAASQIDKYKKYPSSPIWKMRRAGTLPMGNRAKSATGAANSMVPGG